MFSLFSFKIITIILSSIKIPYMEGILKKIAKKQKRMKKVFSKQIAKV